MRDNLVNQIICSEEAKLGSIIEPNIAVNVDITQIVSSQNADWVSLPNYSVIFVDIDLSTKSDMDGYSVIQKINSINPQFLKRIIVLTGNFRIEEMLKERGINPKSILIVNKPTNFVEITDAINKVTKVS